MEKVIEINGLKKFYRKNAVLKGISFDVERGEIFGLLGPNGAGKSTIINILLGLINFDSGEIKILGKNFPREREFISQKMNVVAARTSLTGILTVKENLKIYGKLYNVSNLGEKIDELLELFEIPDLKDKQLQTLSAGQHTRVTLCKGLINDPEILLLDECTMGLDPDIAEKTREVIKRIQKDNMTTIIFTSHNMNEVEELCHRIAFLNRGEILKIDTAEEFKKLIKNQVVYIRVSDIGKAKEIFEKEKIKLSEFKDDEIVFEIQNIDNSLQKILEPLITNGIKIKDLSLKGASLEEVFIKIARGEL